MAVVSAGAFVAAALPPLLLLPEPHAEMDAAIETAAVITMSFFNFITLTPPDFVYHSCA
ncbi:hypothetical protein D3C80_2039480 [compost metagenome]